jgi:FtsP/CotA-like multicopper oxidase with cupredoxin domain
MRMKTFIASGCLVFLCCCANAQTPLFIPDTLAGQNISLTMHADSVSFFPGIKSRTYAYNQYSYLGPTLIFQQGQPMNITVQNQVNDTTTVHWHGIHLPAKWDGGPHTMIMSGETWNPQFTVLDRAATYWYHPHLHKKTALQAIKGAAGLIIVRDQQEANLNLPRKYGVDDIPIIVQSQQYDSLNQVMPLGMEDSTLLVNGARANYGYEVFANLPAQIVRLRLLNASGERVFNFGFSENTVFKQIASDGGLLNQPVETTRVRLAPGERAEVLLDLTGMENDSLFLMSYASELPMGVQGGPTMPMPPGSPPMDSPLNGVNFSILKINVLAQTPAPILTIPTVLGNDIPYDTSSASITRIIRFTADSIMVMDGPFYFNDSSFNMDRIDFIIPLNQTEVWKLVNETMVGHPFHIHDVQFYLVDRNGNNPIPQEQGRKDVVYLQTGDSILFVTKFEDFADSITPYMFHCHVLMHEDAGMMGQFLVVPPEYVGINQLKLSKTLNIYPNPTCDFIEMNLPNKNQLVDAYISDLRGNILMEKHQTDDITWDATRLETGRYYVFVKSGRDFYHASFVKE